MKYILVVNAIENKRHSAAYQRANLLASLNGQTILFCRAQPPEEIAKRFDLLHVIDYGILGELRLLWSLFFLRSNKSIIYTQYRLNTLLSGFIAKRFFGMTWVYDLWDHPSLGFHMTGIIQRAVRSGTWKIGFQMIKSCDLVVVAMSDGILKHLPALQNRILKVGRGYDLESFERRGRIRKPRAKQANSKISMLNSGWLTKQRGVDSMLGLLSELEKKNVDAVIESAGWADDYAYEKVLSHNSRCQNKLIFHGQLDSESLRVLYRECQFGLCFLDKNILNYRYAYPIKIGEYLLNGLTVIASNTEGVRATIKDGVTGYIVNDEIMDSIDILSGVRLGRNSMLPRNEDFFDLERELNLDIVNEKISHALSAL